VEGQGLTQGDFMSIIGADLGGTNFRAGWVSDGALSKFVWAPIDGNATMEEVLAVLYKLLDAVASK